MDRFTIMKSLVYVVRYESFASAARALSISRALVSRHIADLESQIGVRLLNRTTRSVSLTEAGKQYLGFAQRILNEIAEEDASMVAMRENAEGELSVLAPKWIGALDLGEAMADFAVQHPKIKVRIEIGGMSKRTYNFVEDGYDIAFHTKHQRDSSIMVKKIAPLHFVLCAAPGYLSRGPVPETPQELVQHAALVHTSEPVWRFGKRGKAIQFRPKQIAFSSNAYLMLQKATLRGMGIALLPVRSVYHELQAGTLQPLLTNYSVPIQPLYAAYAPSRQLVRKVRVFVDFIADWFQRQPTSEKSRKG